MDRDLREAKRSGNRVDLLRSRLRVGEVSQQQVELAARLGHLAALELFSDLEPVDLADEDSGGEALAGAGEVLRNDTLHARLALESARRVLRVWEVEFVNDMRPREALAAVHAWLECPCVQHTLEAGAAGNQLGHVFRTDEEEHMLINDPDRFRLVSAAGQAACSAAIAARTVGAETGAGVVTGIRSAWSALDHAATAAGEDSDSERAWQRLRLASYALGEVGELPNE